VNLEVLKPRKQHLIDEPLVTHSFFTGLLWIRKPSVLRINLIASHTEDLIYHVSLASVDGAQPSSALVGSSSRGVRGPRRSSKSGAGVRGLKVRLPSGRTVLD